MDYRFRIGTYDEPALESEIALALDARSALSMRKRGAKPTAQQARKAPAPQAAKRNKILGIVCIVIGAAMVLYVTTMAERSKLLQILGFLVIGVGLMLMRSGAPADAEPHARPRSVQQAQKLLIALRQGNFANGLCVSFDEEKMTLSTQSSSSEVAYGELHSVIETEHLWFISYGQAGVALQKCDLQQGDAADFLSRIAAQSGCSTEIVPWKREDAAPEAERE